MLLGNKKKLIETHLENVLWGNVKLLSKNPENGWGFVNGEMREFLTDLQKWSNVYSQNNTSTEFETLTEKLYSNITEYRLMGLIQGSYIDIDHIIEKLKGENTQLAEQLSQAYIPPQDKKIGTI